MGTEGGDGHPQAGREDPPETWPGLQLPEHREEPASRRPVRGVPVQRPLNPGPDPELPRPPELPELETEGGGSGGCLLWGWPGGAGTRLWWLRVFKFVLSPVRVSPNPESPPLWAEKNTRRERFSQPWNVPSQRAMSTPLFLKVMATSKGHTWGACPPPQRGRSLRKEALSSAELPQGAQSWAAGKPWRQLRSASVQPGQRASVRDWLGAQHSRRWGRPAKGQVGGGWKITRSGAPGEGGLGVSGPPELTGFL